jgi:hypothetical protein
MSDVRDIRIARLEQALRSVMKNWDEFGPYHGFGEIIDMAERALTDDASIGEPLEDDCPPPAPAARDIGGDEKL